MKTAPKQFYLVRPLGVGPRTLSLRGICSANWAMGALKFSGALARIRTRNNGSEDHCDIHFTTRASFKILR